MYTPPSWFMLSLHRQYKKLSMFSASTMCIWSDLNRQLNFPFSLETAFTTQPSFTKMNYWIFGGSLTSSICLFVVEIFLIRLKDYCDSVDLRPIGFEYAVMSLWYSSETQLHKKLWCYSVRISSMYGMSLNLVISCDSLRFASLSTSNFFVR